MVADQYDRRGQLKHEIEHGLREQVGLRWHLNVGTRESDDVDERDAAAERDDDGHDDVEEAVGELAHVRAVQVLVEEPIEFVEFHASSTR